MVFLTLADDVPMNADQTAEKLAALGVLVGVTGARRFRLVLHYWVDDAGVQQTVTAFRQVLG